MIKITPKTIEDEINMPYFDYVEYLIEKYGPAQYDYFHNKFCVSKNNKISRTAEGLFCHHIDEDKAIMLSEPEVAREQPFEYQKASRLVYCNFLEHLLLHIKILTEDLANEEEGRRGVGLGGAMMLWRQLNGFYIGRKAVGWKKNVFGVVKDKYDEYISIMQHLKSVIENTKATDYCTIESLAYDWDGRLIMDIYKDIAPDKQTSKVMLTVD